MGKKVDERLVVVGTSELIRKKFLKMLACDSLSKITISGLANEAGIDRSTFYRHYADIEDLARSCRLLMVGAVVDILKTCFPESVQGSSLVMVKAIFDLVDSNEDYFVADLVYKRLPLPTSFNQDLICAMKEDEELYQMLTHSEVKSPIDIAVVSFNIDFVLGGMISTVEGWLSRRRGGGLDLSPNAMAVQAAGWFNVLAALCESNKESLRAFDPSKA